MAPALSFYLAHSELVNVTQLYMIMMNKKKEKAVLSIGSTFYALCTSETRPGKALCV